MQIDSNPDEGHQVVMLNVYRGQRPMVLVLTDPTWFLFPGGWSIWGAAAKGALVLLGLVIGGLGVLHWMGWNTPAAFIGLKLGLIALGSYGFIHLQQRNEQKAQLIVAGAVEDANNDRPLRVNAEMVLPSSILRGFRPGLGDRFSLLYEDEADIREIKLKGNRQTRAALQSLFQ